jgi:hypothetical protein
MRALLAGPKNVIGIALTLLALGVFVYAIFAAQGFRDVSRWFPIGVSVVGVVLALAVMLWELGIVTAGSSESLEGDAAEADSDSSMSARRGFVVYMSWLVALAAGLVFLGAPIAVFGWLLLFFRFQSREGWGRSLLYSLAAVVALVLLGAILHLFLPAGSLVPSGTWVPHINIKF